MPKLWERCPMAEGERRWCRGKRLWWRGEHRWWRGNAAGGGGTPLVEGGTPLVEGGTLLVEGRTPLVEVGTPLVEEGTPLVEGGTPLPGERQSLTGQQNKTPKRTAARGVVVVIGDIMADVAIKPKGGVRFGSDTSSDIRLGVGGTGANTAIHLARLGVDVVLLGRVGDDELGRFVAARLKAEGVELPGAPAAKEATGAIGILVDGSGQRTMFPQQGANARVTEGFVRAHWPGEDTGGVEGVDSGVRGTSAAGFDPRKLRTVAALFVSGYALFRKTTRAGALWAMAQARTMGAPVFVDPASYAFIEDVGAARFLQWTEGASVLLPNREEARVLAQGLAEETMDEAAAEAARETSGEAVGRPAEGEIPDEAAGEAARETSRETVRHPAEGEVPDEAAGEAARETARETVRHPAEGEVPDDAEAAVDGETRIPRNGARRLARRIPTVVVTLDAAGAVVARREEGGGIRTVHIPGEKAHVVDTTGAGDAFNAAFIAAFLAGRSVEDAVREGHRLAARVVERIGPT